MISELWEFRVFVGVFRGLGFRISEIRIESLRRV